MPFKSFQDNAPISAECLQLAATNMTQRLILLSGLAAVAIAFNVSANDSIARVAAGGLTLVKSRDIKMLEETLEVSKAKIKVRYRFLNESNTDIAAKVAFPMPTYGWDPENLNARPLKGFSVTVDGIPAPTQRLRKAYFKKQEITDNLRSIGLSDVQMFEDFGGKCDQRSTDIPVGCALTEKQRRQVSRLLGKSDYYPSWEVEETYVWEQTFPAGREIEVEHEYSPFVGGRYDYPYWGGRRQERYQLPTARAKEACVDDAITQAVNRKVEALVARGASAVQVRNSDIEYILGTGRNWKGPIGQFTLRIQKDSPDEIVSLCMPGKPRKVGDSSIEFRQADFVPQERLVVYFYSVAAQR